MEQLKKAVRQEVKARKQQTLTHIKKGYCDEWADEQKRPSDNGLKQHLTATRFKQYEAGTITRTQAVEFASKRAIKNFEKQEANQIKKIEEVEAAPSLGKLTIAVEWRRSRTWGGIPTATIHAYNEQGEFIGVYTGTASGCGYDKESAAIAHALNECKSALKALYTIENKRLTKSKNTARREYVGYSSGYGALPYFEGGCGYESTAAIFRNMGFTTENAGSGQYFDLYIIKKD